MCVYSWNYAINHNKKKKRWQWKTDHIDKAKIKQIKSRHEHKYSK